MRASGPWATASLNKNEENKKNDDGLNVRQRIIDIYSKAGFDSIDPADLRGRFRWYGLYTQRRPGIDGGKTATLEPEELDDRYFMLRIRIDGGLLTSEQLRVIAGISRDYARGTADVTDRQNVQLHWVEIEASRRSGTPWRRSAWTRPKPAATRPGSSSAVPGRRRHRRDHRRDRGDHRDKRAVHRRRVTVQPAA